VQQCSSERERESCTKFVTKFAENVRDEIRGAILQFIIVLPTIIIRILGCVYRRACEGRGRTLEMEKGSVGNCTRPFPRIGMQTHISALSYTPLCARNLAVHFMNSAGIRLFPSTRTKLSTGKIFSEHQHAYIYIYIYIYVRSRGKFPRVDSRRLVQNPAIHIHLHATRRTTIYVQFLLDFRVNSFDIQLEAFETEDGETETQMTFSQLLIFDKHARFLLRILAENARLLIVHQVRASSRTFVRAHTAPRPK